MTLKLVALSRLTWVCLLVAAAAVICSPPASGDEDTPAGDASLAEVVEVVLVNVEVWVTDRKGNPVHGLGEADFEVLEDGRQMEITHLTEMRGGQEAALEPPSEHSAADIWRRIR